MYQNRFNDLRLLVSFFLWIISTLPILTEWFASKTSYTIALIVFMFSNLSIKINFLFNICRWTIITFNFVYDSTIIWFFVIIVFRNLFKIIIASSNYFDVLTTYILNIIYIYITECVCSILQNLFFRLFLKFLCHLIEKLPWSVLVKTELKYLL